MFHFKTHLILLLALLNYISPRIIFKRNASDCFLNKKGTNDIFYCAELVNDPIFLNQWMHVPRPYEQLDNKTTVDLGIVDVWIQYGFMGKGVTVVINDDGIETDHPEFKSRINLDISYDFCDNSPDPNSKYSLSHGTKIAGIIGMEINNKFCGVGVAPEVTLGARRMRTNEAGCSYNVGDQFTKEQENTDITVNSYGAHTVEEIPYYVLGALKESVEKGRNGLGTVHIFAGGNNKYSEQTCAYDKYLPNIYVVVVAAITPWGETSPYSSRCPNILVAAPSLQSFVNFLVTTCLQHGCTGQFGGTSAAAPVVGGVVSLTFNANAFLTWRDVHHLLVISSSSDKVEENSKTFHKNGAGLLVSQDHGFGIINALRMVELAMFFDPVPELKQCQISVPLKKATLRGNYSITVQSDGCIDSYSDTVMYLEHVQLEVEISYPKWYNLEIDVISPMKTVVSMLEKEKPGNDTWPSPFRWIFDSVAAWGENPMGIWQIIINENYSSNGTIHLLNLILYGTSTKPSHLNVNY